VREAQWWPSSVRSGSFCLFRDIYGGFAQGRYVFDGERSSDTGLSDRSPGPGAGSAE